MSENITMTIHLSGGASGIQTFNLDNDSTPPLPPQDEEDMELSFHLDDPAPPAEDNDNDNDEASISSTAAQVESTNAPPPDYDDEADTDASDEEIDGPIPP